MSELKQFLRFEISGYIVILYVFLFILISFDLNKIKSIFDKDILGFAIGSFVAAAPLGYIMHQIDISINSPFKEKPCGVERYAIKELKEKDYPIFKDIRTPQMSLEIFKGFLYSDEEKYNFNYFKDEISNRYSYYYSRMEASVYSPIFGAIIFLIIAAVYWSNSKNNPFIELNLERVLFIITIIVFIIILSRRIHAYCKNIIEEIDDIEYFLVNKHDELIIKEFKK